MNSKNEVVADPEDITGLVYLEPGSTTDDGIYIPDFSGLDLLEKTTGGDFYRFYNQDGTPDLARDVAEELAQEQELFRVKRDSALKASDVFMLVDKYADLTAARKTEITDYRKALRDSTVLWIMPKPLAWV